MAMEQILPYSYTFSDHDEKMTELSKWIMKHPGTKVKFKDINDTNIFGIVLFSIAYIYDCEAKTLYAENGSVVQTTYNNTDVATSSMLELLDAFDKVGTQSNHINRAPITAYTGRQSGVTFSQDSEFAENDEFTNMDSNTVAFQIQLQNLRKHKKGMIVYYTISGTDATLNFSMTGVQYTFSFHYDIDTKLSSRLIFNQPAPESLLIWIINREWLSTSRSLNVLCSWLIDIISVAEAHIDHDFHFMTEALDLFEIHNIGLAEYDWTDKENVCFSETHVRTQDITRLLEIVADKLDQNKKSIESSHINAIYPIINYYLASSNFNSLLCNIDIYKLIVRIVHAITDTYKLELSSNMKNCMLSYISGPNADDILGSKHSAFFGELMEL
jgi:hypothetical protein